MYIGNPLIVDGWRKEFIFQPATLFAGRYLQL